MNEPPQDLPQDSDWPPAFRDLQRRHDRLIQILQCTGEGVYSIDHEARCTFCNEAVWRMLGFGREELIGVDIHALIHHTRSDGSAYPADECPACRTARYGTETPLHEEVLWRLDGQPLPVESSSFPTHSAVLISEAPSTVGSSP